MSQYRFADMSEAEFDALIDGYIERTASGSGEMPADVFVDPLIERITARTEYDADARNRRAGRSGGHYARPR
jgi:hypothetical protein